jgi:hypothetical protein
MRTEEIVAKFFVLSWHMREETEENYEQLIRNSRFLLEAFVYPGFAEYEAEVVTFRSVLPPGLPTSDL